MDNSINFKGVFWLKQPTTTIKKEIMPYLGKRRQIFNNFTPEGDVLYVTRKSADRNVAEFLTHHRTKFEYYPDLSTKSGFDDEMSAEAKKIIESSNSRILTSIDELKAFFNLKKKTILPFSTKAKKNPIELTAKALGYDLEKYTLIPKDGYYEVCNQKGVVEAKISGPGKYGIAFAKKLKGEDGIPERYAIRGGKKIFKYNSGPSILQFNKNFKRAANANKQNIRPE